MFYRVKLTSEELEDIEQAEEFNEDNTGSLLSFVSIEEDGEDWIIGFATLGDADAWVESVDDAAYFFGNELTTGAGEKMDRLLERITNEEEEEEDD